VRAVRGVGGPGRGQGGRGPAGAIGPGEYALLAAAGAAAGAVNAVAGGGSLISFPALVAAGVPPLAANVTNQVAVTPGYLGGSLAYREELRGQRRRVVALAVSSGAGALVGAALLVVSSEHLFEVLAPGLVLFAVVLLAAQPALKRWVSHERTHPHHGLHAANFLASVYGGYFGAGLGIMLLAILALGLRDTLHRLNALKGVLSLVVASVAAVYFALFGPVHWGPAAVMAVASFAGGQVGVRFARRIGERTLRLGIVVLGTGVAAWLLVRL
jgi:uncharacterized membrane protein YfcA